MEAFVKATFMEASTRDTFMEFYTEASVKASMEATFINNFHEASSMETSTKASMRATFIEFSMEASMEATFMDASTRPSNEASIQVTFMKAWTETSVSFLWSFRKLFRGSYFHGSYFHGSSRGSFYLHESFRGNFCFHESFRGSSRHFHGSTWNFTQKQLPASGCFRGICRSNFRNFRGNGFRSTFRGSFHGCIFHVSFRGSSGHRSTSPSPSLREGGPSSEASANNHLSSMPMGEIRGKSGARSRGTNYHTRTNSPTCTFFHGNFHKGCTACTAA